MNCSKAAFWLSLWIVPLQCTTDQNLTNSSSEQITLDSLNAFPIAQKKQAKKKGNGKLKDAETLRQVYSKTNLSTLPLPFIDQNLVHALNQQQKLLKLRKQDYNQQFSNISLNIDDLKTTISLIELWQQTFPQGLAEHLDGYQLKGVDGKGHVKFTGYFTPEIAVSKKKTKQFPYPIYAFPKNWEGTLPTRAEIDEKAVLKGRGLELAYAQRLEDIYYMQLQGSGLVRYRDGQQAYFAYAGSNRHPYSSIGKHIKNNESISLRNISMEGIKKYLRYHPEMVKPILFTNPSYIFFEVSNSLPLGAGHVPLTADYSIAVDINHIPLGSCLLAAIPVLDEAGDFAHHEYKILVAQDVGGAIRGNGHVDVYCGVGDEGRKKAMALHHYGQLWLLLPKPSEAVGPVLSEGFFVKELQVVD